MEEDTLVEMATKGNEEAFEALLGPHILNARKTAYLLLHDYSLAEDAVLEAMLQTYYSLKRFNPNKGLFKTWFNGIVVNCALKTSRRKRFWLQIGKQPADHHTPEMKHLIDENAKSIYSCVQQLSFKLRAVIILHYYQELSIEEIGDTLQINHGTVKSRLFNARKKLKKLMRENPDVDNSMGGNAVWNKN